MAISLFSFNFRLGPWEGCLNLNFDQIELAPGFAAVCTRDHLGILWVETLSRTRLHAPLPTHLRERSFMPMLFFPSLLGLCSKSSPSRGWRFEIVCRWES